VTLGCGTAWDLHYNRGVGHHDAGRYADAIEAYRDSILASPDRFEARFNLALVYEASGRADRAISTYEEIKLLWPNHIPTLLNLASIKMANGDRLAADSLIESALKADGGETPEPFLLRARYAYETGRREIAGDYYRKAYEVAPYRASCQYAWGHWLLQQNRAEEGVDLLVEAAGQDPQSFEYQVAAADCLKALNRFSRAMEYYRRALTVTDDAPAVLKSLYTMQIDQRLYEEALVTLWKARRIDEGNVEVRRLLASVYRLLMERDSLEPTMPARAAEPE
jgi:tetratricopeptide (TPR) repeat protein